MIKERAAGVLCHISSLGGKYGIGSLGNEAYRFAKNLAGSGVKYWQVLPIVQTGYGDSPYQSVACNSGNPYFIDLEALKREGLLTKKELKSARRKGDVDYASLYRDRYTLLRKAFSRFFFDSAEFREYVNQGKSEEYALFMTAKTVYGGSFHEWNDALKYREPAALEALRTDYHEEYLFWHFLQFIFWKQWSALKAYCNGLGLKIIGDLPLYVAYDSADVWSHPDLFKLDKDLKPLKVAGVPPDYFSESGQLWGNPIYDWNKHEKQEFAWWKGRLSAALEMYDLVRIDHFRGLDRYYEIDGGREDARVGEWKDGPREKLFGGIEKDCLIAEDLGDIDDGVRKLLEEVGFPGMKVLLFAFDGNPNNPFLPENIPENSVCYTGTHDNNTVCSYLETLSAEEFIIFRSRVAAELEKAGIALSLGEGGKQFSRALAELCFSTRAAIAVVPIQDLLGLGKEARMNTPGKESGNWVFRLDSVPSEMFKYLKGAIRRSGR